MSLPAESSLLFLAAAAIGTIVLVSITKPREKQAPRGSLSRNVIIHNLLRKEIRSPMIGAIQPGKSIRLENRELAKNSIWSLGWSGLPFLRLGSQLGDHVYIGGVCGEYVYTDQLEITAPLDGPKELLIVNLTQVELRLLGIPPIPPGSALLYRGSTGTGLDLGTRFIDTANVFHEYVMHRPITKLFYGELTDSPPSDVVVRLSDVWDQSGFSIANPGGVLV